MFHTSMVFLLSLHSHIFLLRIKKKKNPAAIMFMSPHIGGWCLFSIISGEKPAASQGMGRKERGSVSTSLSSQLLVCGLLSHDCPGRKNLRESGCWGRWWWGPEKLKAGNSRSDKAEKAGVRSRVEGCE